MTLGDPRRRELGGPDPLDRRLGAPPLTAFDWLRSLMFTRSALGLAPSLTPAIIFLPLGALLGPQGLGWFTPLVLERLDAAVSIALAVLGVLVGLALGRELRGPLRLLTIASVESIVTVAAVGLATMFFVRETPLPIELTVAFLLAIGLCASASSATSSSPDSEAAAAVATRVADLDDVLPILLTMVAFAFVTPETGMAVVVQGLAPTGLGLTVALIGWLLFERAESGAERAVYVLGTMSLAGGAAAYLRVSPLAAGLVAGLVWAFVRGRAGRIVSDDVGRVQHPLIVLLLLSAGALWVPSALALWLLVPYVLFRLVGKILGAAVTARFVDVSPGDLAAFLMPPGVLAVAFALNFQQVLPDDTGAILVSTVAMGTAVFELLALAVVPHWRRGSR